MAHKTNALGTITDDGARMDVVLATKVVSNQIIDLSECSSNRPFHRL